MKVNGIEKNGVSVMIKKYIYGVLVLLVAIALSFFTMESNLGHISKGVVYVIVLFLLMLVGRKIYRS